MGVADDLKKKYSKYVDAEALIFAYDKPPHPHKALRIEAQSLGKEFTDDAYIGTDPRGSLYFNNVESFDGEQMTYKVYKVVEGTETYAHIKFYHGKEEDAHIEFLGRDPEGAVDAAGMNGYTNSGKWADLNLNTSPATVKKYNDKQTITVEFNINPKHVTGTVTIPNDVLKGETVDVKGTFFYKDINLVKDGVSANYNNDRIVFYKDDYLAKDFTGFFMPYEYSVNKLGITTTDTRVFDKAVKWTGL